MSVLTPVTHALSAVIAGAHSGLATLGLDPSAGPIWVLSIAAVVVVVRLALLPFVVHGVRQAHAGARARPQLRALAERYRDRTDMESLRSLARERRRISAEQGLSRWGLLPTFVQIPVWLGLYHLLSNVAAGTAVGAMTAGLVASLGTATLLGVPLAQRGYLGSGVGHLAVVAGLAGLAALLAFVTQRYFVIPNTVLGDLPASVARTHQLMPAISALGMIIAGGAVPLALLVYWVCNSTWTLGQSAVVWRWFPTPGSAAAGAR